MMMMTKTKRRNDEEDDGPPPPEQKLCSKQACAIQYCLNRYDHQEKKCKAFIDDWNKCRDRARQAAAAATEQS
jgi:hypothetical protein